MRPSIRFLLLAGMSVAVMAAALFYFVPLQAPRGFYQWLQPQFRGTLRITTEAGGAREIIALLRTHTLNAKGKVTSTSTYICRRDPDCSEKNSTQYRSVFMRGAGKVATICVVSREIENLPHYVSFLQWSVFRKNERERVK